MEDDEYFDIKKLDTLLEKYGVRVRYDLRKNLIEFIQEQIEHALHEAWLDSAAADE
jgi:hypothetical protein